jgi:glycerol-3-phosphate acyltransferase PlsY
MIKEIIFYILFSVCGYFIGSLSPAVFLSKKVAGIDIREKGSKNAGSTNVYRVMGAKWGIINFVFDLLKGFLPTLIGLLVARAIGGAYEGWLGAVLAASGVLLGHAFPVFNRFRGGKCVASMTGAMFILYPALTGIVFVYALLIIVTTRWVSLASTTSFVLIPASVWVFKNLLGLTLPVQIFTTFFAALIIFLHRENIVRLFKGEESKLDLHKKSEY